METPKNKPGQLTEKIMHRVRLKIPDLSTSDYNRVYESVYQILVFIDDDELSSYFMERKEKCREVSENEYRKEYQRMAAEKDYDKNDTTMSQQQPNWKSIGKNRPGGGKARGRSRRGN